MESLILSINSIAPIFILMLLGYFLKKIKIADKKTFDSINKLVFRVFLPVLLFYNIYKSDIKSVFDLKLVIFSVTGVVAVFVVAYLISILITKENTKRSVVVQGFFRSNFALLGLPLVGYIYGENAGGVAALMSAIVVPLFNVLAIIVFERFGNGEERLNAFKILKGVIKNPLIIGCLAGIAVLLTGIKLPGIIEKSVKDISAIASPLAIIVLGAVFEYSTIKESVKELVITVSAKLVFVPLVAIAAAILLGFTGEALVCILITFGAPVAVSSFSMAQQMGGDEQLSAHLVVISSALCLVTLFGWIFVLSRLNLL